jgi:cation diffusion facilitator CzcD-associated flavoprotein CzcO
MVEHFDTVIIGAGLSGIGAACHHQRECPERNFVVLEARARMGGTWDLFRYPGIRSDSEMHTLGYDFKPWTDKKAIADGPQILKYIKDTAADFGIEDKIRYNSKVIGMEWNSAEARWSLTLAGADGTPSTLSANFIISAAGYYDYDKPHNPHFDGREDFQGDIIHPQHWPENYDTAGKRIIVIGSGATAVTLIPSLAKTAQHVTMLQRSPSWIASQPDTDRLANFFQAVLPEKLAYKLTRAKAIAYSRYIYNTAQKKPKKTGDYLLKQIRKELGPDFDVETHFTPTYNPWDQRLCLVPNSDLFKSMNSGKASVVTDHIERFVPEGIRLKSGQTLRADLIVTATGLNVVFCGDVKLRIDGVEKNIADSFGYRGLMFSGIPNMVSVFGYTNASWTLRADLVSRFACRVMNHMDAAGDDTVVPEAPKDLTPRGWLDFEAGYITRVIDQLPKQGDRDPWQNKQDYKFDRKTLLSSAVDHECLIYKSSKSKAAA